MGDPTNDVAIHNAYWLRQGSLEPNFPVLADDHQAEVLVVGGGITGLSIAWELLQRGHQVTVCEANTIGSGTTGGSSGHLDAHPEMGASELIEQLGPENAQAFTKMRLQAIDSIRARANPETEFSACPGYYYTEQASHLDRLKQQCEAAKKLGLTTTWLDEVPIAQAAGGYQVDGLARIDSLAYVRHLAKLVQDAGGTIFERTMMSSPSGEHPRSVSSAQGSVRFEHVVFAVHCEFTGSQRLYVQTPPYQSYVIAAKVSEPLHDGQFWDDSQPYYYVRRATDEGRTILVGGCDHRTGDGDEQQSLENLEQWMRHRFDVTEIVSRWSAELFEPTDGLPFIGKVADKENVWTAIGLSGIGLTLGTAAGPLLADLIEAKSHPLEEALSPARLPIGSIVDLVTEQSPVVGNYAEQFCPASSIDPASVEPGQGKVGKVDGKFVAMCRDAKGSTQQFSPICPHQGGVLHWNPVEQTWDCPVHGGRFNCHGVRMYGPPESDMSKPSEE